jgi:hypothetical protein
MNDNYSTSKFHFGELADWDDDDNDDDYYYYYVTRSGEGGH